MFGSGQATCYYITAVISLADIHIPTATITPKCPIPHLYSSRIFFCKKNFSKDKRADKYVRPYRRIKTNIAKIKKGRFVNRPFGISDVPNLIGAACRFDFEQDAAVDSTALGRFVAAESDAFDRVARPAENLIRVGFAESFRFQRNVMLF